MLALPDIRLATPGEAPVIARMSRDFIEHGLGWRWTPERVRLALLDRSTNVAVILRRDAVCGFGIMQYGDATAHLALLAVRPAMRHQGLGKRLVAWLEDSATAAGIDRIRVEARADNPTALAFYQRLGYHQSGRSAGYYDGVIDAVQFEKKTA